MWFPLPALPLRAAGMAKNLTYDSYRWYKSPSSLLFYCPGVHIGVLGLKIEGIWGIWFRLSPLLLVKIPMRAKSVFFSGRWVFVIVLGKGRSPFGSLKANFWPLTENGGVFSSNLVALRAFAHLYLVALPPWWSAIWPCAFWKLVKSPWIIRNIESKTNCDGKGAGKCAHVQKKSPPTTGVEVAIHTRIGMGGMWLHLGR